MVLPVADDPRLAQHPHAVGHQQGPGVADAVRLEPLDLLDNLTREQRRAALRHRSRGLSPIVRASALRGNGGRTARRRREAAGGSLRPAAAAWPPKASKPSEHALIASYRLKPGIDRADPCPCDQSPSATTTAGR